MNRLFERAFAASLVCLGFALPSEAQAADLQNRSFKSRAARSTWAS
jgi:hypothetical protein